MYALAVEDERVVLIWEVFGIAPHILPLKVLFLMILYPKIAVRMFVEANNPNTSLIIYCHYYQIKVSIVNHWIITNDSQQMTQQLPPKVAGVEEMCCKVLKIEYFSDILAWACRVPHGCHTC